MSNAAFFKSRWCTAESVSWMFLLVALGLALKEPKGMQNMESFFSPVVLLRVGRRC